MKTIVIILALLLQQPSFQKEDSLCVMFWNLENFFDWRADSTSSSTSDKEFSSFGTRHWTKRKFQAKCDAIAKSIFWVESLHGMPPDVIGVAEVENRFVLKRLLEGTLLRKVGYSAVHYDSPDPRGIDVALLYRGDRLKLLDSKPLMVEGSKNGEKMKTRDILMATFLEESGDSIAFLVNHHPSKYGDDSQWRRIVAMKCLRGACDSLSKAGFERIAAMGDFNDTPDNPAFRIATEAGEYAPGALFNLSEPLFRKGQGTIRYEGKWDLIDMFIVSRSLAEGLGERKMEILRIPFLMVRDNAYSGEKPLRTYSGPRYIGGVSDHCPILLIL